MTSEEIRQRFLNFFKSKDHHIVPSVPMVVKNDPTLMFTNAGMNPFKDIFLGSRDPDFSRIANTQKCLRVSGKHNDLEEVGKDTYHHTMFEMLGNWSFGDYFKEEAIGWAWEFLTEIMKIESGRLYATVFEGSKADKLDPDTESMKLWKGFLPKQHILNGSKKDNFWEMGDTGPCGPCSEIHIDLRSEMEREIAPGHTLVNSGHPLVIEIWNLVFIQYNRKEDSSLVPLPQKHVDTGMGFERLCMVMQKKSSNYDTDLFTPIIQELEALSLIKYGKDNDSDMAMRVVADHLRAVAFAIADNELPSNTGAGYVIRRILRRAVRYGYTFLEKQDPFIYKLLPVLVNIMGRAYPELKAQQQLISDVIYSEEQTFLRTLEAGMKHLDGVISVNKDQGSKIIGGKTVFLLYDTYGFPVDLTGLIAAEHGMEVDMDGFNREMAQQKQRSKKAVKLESAAWIVLDSRGGGVFNGYDHLEEEIHILRYREVKEKNKQYYHLVFDKTPFYAESGGQIGDRGWIESNDEKVVILDTRKENDMIIHVTEKMPSHPATPYRAIVNGERRLSAARNHTATHLLHAALRRLLGSHVEQKGSLVHPDYLRFDFSHFEKLSDDEKKKITADVNAAIRKNISLDEQKEVPIDQAKSMGAMSLFGEKYGSTVRVIRFGESIELCGGTHVAHTGQIGCFVITAESSIAAGIRRIEAVTGEKAIQYIIERLHIIEETGKLLKSSTGITAQVKGLLDENNALKKQVEKLSADRLSALVQEIKDKTRQEGQVRVAGEIVKVESAKQLKDIAFRLKQQVPSLFLVLGAVIDNKPALAVMIDEELVKRQNLDARQVIQEASALIQGGGGGQPFFATAGGKNSGGLGAAVEKALSFIRQ